MREKGKLCCGVVVGTRWVFPKFKKWLTTRGVRTERVFFGSFFESRTLESNLFVNWKIKDISRTHPRDQRRHCIRTYAGRGIGRSVSGMSATATEENAC